MDSGKRTVLIFSEGISYCHIVRPLIVSRWLKELDLDLLVACTTKAEPLFKAEGLATLIVETADPKLIFARLARGSYLYSEDEMSEYYRKDAALLDRIEPSLIIADFRFSLLHLASARSIPSVGMTSASCHPAYPLSKQTPNAFISPSWLPARLFDAMHRTWFGRRVQNSVIKAISVNYQRASERHGLEPLGSFFEYASQGDLCLLCDDPEVMPLPKLRAQDVYTGALIWDRIDDLPNEFYKLDPTRKKVYITIGTQESLKVGFVKPLVLGLVKQGCSVILSKGKRDIDLEIDAPNVVIVDFINESKLLPEIDLYIYHGSAMSTYQGLAAGVPMISIPAQADQHFHSEALVRLGVGELIRPVELKTERLLAIAEKMLTNSDTRDHSRQFAEQIRLRSNKVEVIDRIQGLLQSRHCQSSATNFGDLR